jgi:hypothetical protein
VRHARDACAWIGVERDPCPAGLKACSLRLAGCGGLHSATSSSKMWLWHSLRWKTRVNHDATVGEVPSPTLKRTFHGMRVGRA